MEIREHFKRPENRVAELLAVYKDEKVCAAHVLCDRHPGDSLAYTVVNADLSSIDVSFGELRERSERLARALWSLGLREGDRIATLMRKSERYLVTILAIWRLGAVHVPLFTAFAPSAIALRLDSSRCRLVFCDAVQKPKLAPGNDMPADRSWKVITTGLADTDDLTFDGLMESAEPGFPAAALGGLAPLIQIYTSGTTGKPKGVVVPIKALASFHAYAEFGLGLQPDDAFWNAADPGWGYGLYFGVLAVLTTGARGLFLNAGFSTETTFGVLANYHVTNFAAAPTVFRSLRISGLTPPAGVKLRRATSAGEPLTPEVNDWAISALGIVVHDHYGQTEAGMLVNNHHHPALRRPVKPGSMGHVMPGWKGTILKLDEDEPAGPDEIGRLAFDLAHSPLAWFEGYVDEPGKTAEKFSADGRWYVTGDTAKVDEQGYLYFSARDDDVIIMAGYRIGPFEVESVILTHPAVSECAVVAVPDVIRGEVLEAVVVVREGYPACDELSAEIQAWVKRGYAAHAYPRQVHYAPNLPKTPSGKIQRFVVRQQLRETARKTASWENA
ncbi:AMP-binding protein [Mesorhizobium sp. M1163]|uniref:AMP-binding protein n=1 Tax=Mesorhizobium sp. M1163 TaxID=2957065 RepID=UPI00333C9D5D